MPTRGRVDFRVAGFLPHLRRFFAAVLAFAVMLPTIALNVGAALASVPTAVADVYVIDENDELVVGGDWLFDGWSARREIALTGVGDGEPVAIRIDESRIDYTRTSEDGRDLRFVAAGGEVVPHEMISWADGGESLALLETPPDVGESLIVWMYYGNPHTPDPGEAAVSFELSDAREHVDISFGPQELSGVLANDTSDGPMAATLESGPTNATSFTLHNNGSFVYIPAAGFSGEDTFSYRAVSATAVGEPTNVTVNVVPMPEDPGVELPILANDVPIPSEQALTTLALEANPGQYAADVDFVAQGRGYDVTLGAGEAALTLGNGNSKHEVRMGFRGGAADPEPVGLDPLVSVADTPRYASVTYRDIYPNIDVTYSANGRELEYSFVVHPGSVPSDIALDFSGVRDLKIAEDGTLLVDSRAGRDLKTTAPYTYQEVGGVRALVDSSYTLNGDGTIGFTVGGYDPTIPLVIDPTFVSSASAETVTTSLVLAKPAGVAAGDLMLAQVIVRDDGAGFTPPAGWTLLRSDAFVGELLKQEIYYKVAGGSEPTSYTWTFDKSDEYLGAIAVYRDVDPLNPIHAHDGVMNPPGSPATAPSITTTVADTTLVGLFGHRDDGAFGPPPTMTEQWNTVGAVADLAIEGSDESFAGPGATGVRTAVDATGTANISVLVALAPSPTGDTISGTVFEDIVGDVLNDGAIGDTDNPGAENVDVYLYLDDGDSNLDAGDTLIGGAPTQTTVDGSYSFTGLADGDYFVVVDSKTVNSSLDPGAIQTDMWAEQTYGPTGAYCDNGIGFSISASAGPCYGGIAGHLSDDFSQWDDREHRAAVTLSGASIPNVDFGFSFNVVVNTVGGGNEDWDLATNRTVQGSLRQFIQNANAIDGPNAMRFVPVDPAGATDGTNYWWRVMVTETLPTITGDGTTIDGRAFDFTNGATVLNTNAAQIGAGATVGTEGTYTTPQLDPELEIRNYRPTAVVPTGLVFEANGSVLRHVSIWGFGDSAATFDTNVRMGTTFNTDPDFTGSVVEFNVIGTGPASFTDPGVADRSGNLNLAMRETDNAIVQDNLIGFGGGSGVTFSTASNSGTVRRNEIRRNGILDPIGNPVGVWISGSVIGNLITDNSSGVFSGPTLWIAYQDNTISANGWGASRPHGIWVSGSFVTIQRNVIADNVGAGVVVPSSTDDASIIRNSFLDNGTGGGQIGIDLLATGDDPLASPFVTLNDDGDVDAGGNGLLNYPVIEDVVIQGNNLSVTGWARPGSNIEFYLADLDPTGFGEGQKWLVTKTEGSGDDLDTGSGTYGPGPINGIAQGTDTTNRFRFVIPLASLASAVAESDPITTLATFGNDTSEFSGTVAVRGPIVVNSTGDGIDFDRLDGICSTNGTIVGGDPECTLRAAIDVANYTPSADTIVFNIPTTDTRYSNSPVSFTIEPQTVLPEIDETVTIDGSTQPEFASEGRPVVVLDGSSLSSLDDTLSFVAGADNSMVRGLVFSWSQGDAMSFESVDDITVAGNHVGTDPTGMTDSSDGFGIRVRNSDRATVGGTEPADRNVVSGNSYGILIQMSSADASIVGNYVGVDATGFGAVGNNVYGVMITATGGGHTVGGPTPSERNIISGNMTGLFSNTNDSTIIGNYIGTDVDGTVAVPNTYAGISLSTIATGNRIGGDTPTERNVIAGNTSARGIEIKGADSTGNIVTGNFIGIDRLGNPLGNSNGIRIEDEAHGNRIGGINPGEGNTIAHNNSWAIWARSSAGDDNSIVGNSIHSNAAIGINLGDDNVTLNDVDTGPNDSLNFPEISSAYGAGGLVTLTGTFDVPAGWYRFEFFTSTAADPTGYGEGEALVGSTPLTHTGSGPETWGAAFPGAVDDIITATLTECTDADCDDFDSTSEFSAAVTVVRGPFVVNSTGDAPDDDSLDDVCDTGETIVGGDPECTLRAAIEQGNATAGINTLVFDIPTTASGYSDTPVSFTIQPASLLPAISTPMVIDASTQPEHAVEGRPVVVLDGSGVTAGELNGLYVTGGGSTIRGFVVNNWGDDGIDIETNGGNTIVGNYVGTNATGTAAAPNAWGINAKTSGNVFGGSDAADRNVVSGNTYDGFYIYTAAAVGNTILGNYIGSNATGTATVPNGRSGIYLWQGANGNTIGGSVAGARNVISGNGNYGIDITGIGTDSNDVIGNYIGTNAAGTADLGNSLDGVAIRNGAQGNVVGGSSPADRNIIAGNNNDGVWITGAGTDANEVRGNWIGYGSDARSLGNSYHGVAVENDASGNLVGGRQAGDGNRIGNSGWDGIAVDIGPALENALVGNAISNNGDLGIDLASDGVTLNNPGDSALDFPEINTARWTDGTVTLAGTYDVPAGWYRFEFFANVAADGSGYGEGETLIASTPLTHLGTGAEPWGASFAGSLGSIITATLTECVDVNCLTFKATSEFSAAITVEQGAFVVNSTGDSGDDDWLDNVCDTGGAIMGGDPECTLRAAIEQANSSAGTDTIGFSIPTTDAGYTASPLSYTIAVAVPGSPILPAITDPVIIDGTSQPDYPGTPIIVLDGTNRVDPGTTPDPNGLTLQAGDSTIRGLVIVSANDDAIELEINGGNTIVGNYIGVEVDGTTTAWNGYGISVKSNGNTIGGATPADRNVISGNSNYGIGIYEAASGNVVQGNYIGVTADGTAAIGNGDRGIEITDGANNTIGGTTPGSGNVISGNTDDGIYLDGAGTDDNKILGNNIGTDVTGLSDLGNSDRGVQIESGADNNTVGGATAEARNVISGNGNDGVVIGDGSIPGTGATGNAVEGNYIGVGADGATPLGNGGHGVHITTVDGNTIGGDVAEAGNVIAHNTWEGVIVQNDTASDNSILGNSIHSNGGLGIELGTDGVTLNDVDTGPNDSLNFPVITSAYGSGGIVTLSGTFDVPAGWYRFEFFTNSAADGTGYGEGETWVGSAALSHGGSGDEPFGAAFPGSVGDIITATLTECTDSGCTDFDSTSEFSAAVAVQQGAFVVNSTGDGADDDTGDGVCHTGLNNTQLVPECTLRAAIDQANATPGANTIEFDIPIGETPYAAGVWTIQLTGALPPITGPVSIDATTQPGWTTSPLVRLDGASTTGATGLQIGATAGASRISGLMITRFDVDGIHIAALADGVEVSDNWIGSDNSGLNAMGNGDDGIDVSGADAVIAGNVVNHSGDDGIDVLGPRATITGNLVGLEADGTSGSGNFDVGIALFADDTTIGGSSGGERNTISNNWEGIEVNSSSNTIQGNYIGTDATGTLPRGNRLSDGIEIQAGINNLVGGATIGQGNVIAHNDAMGVEVTGGTANSILGNSIHSNGGIGIELGTDGVTPNDAGDADPGPPEGPSDPPNGYLNFPVIASAYASGGIVTLSGTFDVPAGWYRFEFFTNSVADGTGYGEGETWVGSAALSHGGSGDEPFGAAFPGSLGDIITATLTECTDSGCTDFDSTSEFSAAVTVTTNLAPVAVDDPPAGTLQVSQGSYIGLDVMSNDSDPNGDTLYLESFTQPSIGTVTLLDGGTPFDRSDDSVRYDAPPAASGPTTFTYTISDGLLTDSATVFINVPSPNDPPTANDDVDSTLEDTAVTIVVLGNDSDTDGTLDPASVTITGAASNGGAVANPSGSVTYTPDLDFFGPDSFTYRVCDNDGACDTAVVSVSVTPVNDPPVANDDVVVTPEDVAVSVVVLANDTDVELDTLSVASVTQPLNGTAVVVGTTVTYTPDVDFNGPDSFTYEVSDGNGGTDVGTVNVTVGDVNDPPTANDDVDSTLEDTAVTIDVLSNDTDSDGTLVPSSVVVTVAPSDGGAVVDTGDGSIDYTPNLDSNGPDSFTYQVCDDDGACDTAVVDVTVTPVNDPPTANNDTALTLEDTAVSIVVLANDTDVELDTLSVASVTQPSDGTAVVVGTTVTYTPDVDFNGPDSFTYQVSDGNGGTDTGTVNVTVTPVNDPPTAVDDTASTPEDTAVVISVLANDTDVEGPVVPGSVLVTSSASDGVAMETPGGTVTYTPDLDFFGPDSFTYRVCDNDGACDTAVVSVSVTPVNDPPVANDDVVVTPEDVAVSVVVLANDTDVELDTLSVASVTQPSDGTAVVVGTTVTYTPDVDFNGPDSFTYQVSDGNGGTDTGTVNVTVTPVNDPPTAVDDTASTPEDTAVVISVLANDTDVEGPVVPGSVLVTSSASDGVAMETPGGTVTYTPDLDFFGPDSFTYRVCDNDGACDTAVVSVSVTPVNDPPVANDDVVVTPEDVAVSVVVLANDTDVELDTLSVASVTQPSDGTAVVVGTTVTYTPDVDFNGPDSFTYEVSDGNGGTDVGTVNVTVGDVNDPPTANDDVDSTLEDTAVTIVVLGNDSDTDGTLDPASVTITGAASNGGAVANLSGSVTYTPDLDFFGPDSFTYRVCDNDGACDTAVVSVSVMPVNDPPTANDDTAVTPEDTAVTIPVLNNDSDVEGPLVPGSVLVTSAASDGSAVDGPGGTVTYTPDLDFFGPDSFTYRVCDNDGACDTAVVSVSVTPVNDPPVANDDVVVTPEDVAVSVVVLANDTDVELDTLSVASVTQPSDGTAVVVGTTVTYTPDVDFNGPDSFTYEVSDGNGGTDVGTVNVTVGDVNDPPTANDDVDSTLEDTAVTIVVLGNDSDTDGTLDPASVTITGAASNGGAVANLSGSVTYTPDLDFFGPDSFTYRVCDNDGACDTAVVSVSVMPVNDPPTANDDTAVTPEDTAVVVSVLANDGDVDVDTLTTGSVTNPPNGTAIINPDDTITYTPDPNFNGSDSFDYTASDGAGGIATATAMVTVTPVNDTPNAVADAASTPEDTPVSILVLANDTDVDLDSLAVGNVTNPANGTAAIGGTSVIYTPNLDFSGTDTFSYTVVDGNGGTDTTAITVVVTPVNDAPIAVDDTAATPEDSPVTVAVLPNDTDVDGGTLGTIAAADPANGTVAINGDDTITYDPDTDFHGPDTFTYTVSDGNGGTDTATVTVTVTPVNDTPTVNDDTASTQEDTPTVISVLANDTDIDADPLTVTFVTDPANGVATVNVDGSITYSPDSDFFGTDVFGYAISDGNGGVGTATVTVTVTPVNDAPTVIDDTATTAEDTTVVVPVLVNDFDTDGTLDPGTVSILAAPSNGNVFVDPGGPVTYRPVPDFNGVDTFTYEVCDDAGACNGATVTVTVTRANDPPVLGLIGDRSIDELVGLLFGVFATDVDGDALLFRLSDGTTGSVPAGASIDATTGVFSWTPSEAQGPGVYTFDIVVTDNGSPNRSDAETIMIMVGETNAAPVAEGIPTQSVVGGETVVVSSSAIDVDLPVQPLVWRIVTGPGTVLPDGSYSWATRAADGPGTYAVTLEVSDGSATDTVSFDVNVAEPYVAPPQPPANRGPIAVADGVVMPEDGEVAIAPIANDSDPEGGQLSLVSWGPPTVGTMQILPNGLIGYEPPANFNGAVTAPYTVSDPAGATAQGVITITVVPVNDAPISRPDSATLNSYDPVRIAVLANDSDVDGDTMSIVAISNPEHGKVALTVTGDIVYDPDSGWTGEDRFTYTVSDALGLTATAIVTLDVTQTALVTGRLRATRLGVGALPLVVAEPEEAEEISLNLLATEGVSLLAASFWQTVLALQVPLVFLLLSLGLVFFTGGAGNVLALIGGRRRYYSVVMLGREERLVVYAEPDVDSDVVHEIMPTTRSIYGAGKPRVVKGIPWTPIELPNGAGWAPSRYLVEETDYETFLSDPRPAKLVDEFAGALRTGGSLKKIVSPRGLAIALSDAVTLAEGVEVASLRMNRQKTIVGGGGRGTVGSAEVIDHFLAAYDATHEVSPRTAHSSTALLPSECQNFLYLALESDATGNPWLVYVEYRGRNVYISGLGIDV